MKSKYIKAFMSLFENIARHKNRYEVFRDFVSISGISIQNAFLKSDELEQEYFAIINRYQKEDVERFSELLAQVVMGLESYPCDFLGSVFMELGIGNTNNAQFFTPYEVSKMMAKIVHSGVIDLLSKQQFVTVQEPACGAGGMIVAFSQVMIEEGFNPQTQLFACCIDIDPLAATMAYVQLSLLGIPAEVVIGNSLSMEISQVFRTPFYYLGGWSEKLRVKTETENAPLVVESQSVKTETENAPLVVESQSVKTETENAPLVVESQSVKTETENAPLVVESLSMPTIQLSLFD